MEENSILLTEQNILPIYKQLVGKEEIDQTELDQVKQRFKVLVAHKSMFL